ncbi:MAG: class I SAM-dependent methyltransferase [Anaerolineales bacterium]
MLRSNASQPNYANWVSSKLIFIPGALALLLGGLSIASPWFILPALLLLACSAYFAYARWQFSPQGADIQSRLQALVLRHLDWDGEGQVLDIGCGNGPITIAIAKAYPKARVTGIDPWGASWEYSKTICERNAAIEGVAKSVTFQKGDAATLPFDDGSFDVVVSNLVFHEVRSVSDKRLLIKEALRVLREGGQFVFQDLFLWKEVYGDPAALVGEIRNWGIKQTDLVPTNNCEFIPKALKLPFMVGTIAILYGMK